MFIEITPKAGEGKMILNVNQIETVIPKDKEAKIILITQYNANRHIMVKESYEDILKMIIGSNDYVVVRS